MGLNLKCIAAMAIFSIFISGCDNISNIIDEINESTEESSFLTERFISDDENEVSVKDYKPMVMIDDVIYISTGEKSDVNGRCGVMDGEILSEVSSDQKPEMNEQSNFGTGYGYQYIGTDIDVYMPDGENGENNWIRFKRLSGNTEKPDYVGIGAYIKEVGNDFIIVGSDEENFSGNFSVKRPLETAITDVKKGDYVNIFMEDMKKKTDNDLPEYLEKNTVVIDRKDDLGKYDVFLTDAPSFNLRDILSSKLNTFEIKSENYLWIFTENGEVKSKEAQKKIPPEEPETSMLKLKLPRYNMENVVYSFDTVIPPDILTIYQWDTDDTGNIDTNTRKTATYYYKNPLLYIEMGKVYRFKCEWKKENAYKNNFYGTANYVLQTE